MIRRRRSSTCRSRSRRPPGATFRAGAARAAPARARGRAASGRRSTSSTSRSPPARWSPSGPRCWSRRPICSRIGCSPRSRRARRSSRRWAWSPGHRGALAAAQAIAERGDDAAFLRAVLERRLAAAPSPAERARVLARLALLAENEPERLAEALALFGRALDEDARRRRRARGALGPAARGRAPRARGRAPARLHARGRGAGAGAGARGLARRMAAALGAPSPGRRRARHRSRRAGARRRARRRRAARGGRARITWRRGAGRRALALLDRQAELTVRSRLGGGAAGPRRAHRRAPPGRRPGGGGALPPRAARCSPSNPSTLAALERIASRTGDTKTQVELAVGGRRARRGSRRARRAGGARRRDQRERARTTSRRRSAWRARRWRRCPAIRRRCTCSSGSTRRSALGRHARPRRRRRRRAATPPPRSAPTTSGGRRLERLGLLYEERLGDPGARDGAVRRVGAAGRAPAGGAARAACAPPRRRATRWSPPRRRSSSAPTSPASPTTCRSRGATARRRSTRSAPPPTTRPSAPTSRCWRSRPRFRPALAGLARAHERRKSFEALAAVLSRRAECETNPAHASALEVEAARIAGREPGPPRGGARGARRARWPSTPPTWARSTTTCACCSGSGAATSSRRRWATLAEKLERSGREGGDLPPSGRGLRVAAAPPARGAGGHRAQPGAGVGDARAPAGTATAELVQERLYLLVGPRRRGARCARAKRLPAPAEPGRRGRARRRASG